MASTIARTSEYLTASVAMVLVLSCLVSACSSSPPPPETTGSISRTQVSEPRGAQLPPTIQPPAIVPAARAASYAPPPKLRRQVASRQAASCEPRTRYDRRDVTASIPPTRSAYAAATPVGNRRYVVHTIAPHETLYSISRRYHSDIGAIAAVNRVSTNTKLQYGELLVIPDPH